MTLTLSLSITAGDQTLAEWVWKGLIFYGRGFWTPNEASYPGLYHANFKSLAFHDCSLMLLTGLQLSNVHHVDIRDSMFTQHHHANASACSTLVNNTCWYSNSTLDLEFENNTFIFSGNTIANYTCHSLIYVFITSDCHGDIVVTGNLVTNLYFHDKAQAITLMSFLGHNSNSSINNSAVFSDNFFRNILHSDHVIFLQFHFNVCIIKFNNFSFIVGSSAHDQFICASCISLRACSTAYLAHNQVSDNKNVGLVHVSSSNSIHVTDLVLANNGWNMTDSQMIYLQAKENVTISHVHAEQNHLLIPPRSEDKKLCLLFVCSASSVTVKNVSFNANSMSLSKYSSIFHVACSSLLSVTDVVFSDSIGTPLSTNSQDFECETTNRKTAISLSGKLFFAGNAGVYGGACSFYHANIEFINATKIVFMENHAVSGGAMYMYKSSCFCNDFNNCANVMLESQNNIAVSAGNLIYFDYALVYNYHCFQNFKGLSSYPVNLQFISGENENGFFSLFPGQEIRGNFSLTDHYNHSSFCVANVYLLCEEGHLIVNCAKKQIMLKGSSIVTISQPAGYNWTNVSTDLNLLSPENVSVRVFLKFECEITGTAAFVPLNITRCSLAFIYNESKQVCECVEVADDKSNFLCSRKFGAACVSRGYWFGQVSIGGNTSVYAVVQGAVPEYSSNQPCPPQIMATGGGSDYALLKFHVDDQCSSSRGGNLCRLCRPGYVFTFTALKCVANSTCEPWHPYLVVLISQVFQVVLAITLLCVVRFKVSVGSGYLYGPMLFLSITSSLSITNLRSQYSLLNSFITVVSSLPLLNIEVFGLIPWCFFHPLDKIYNYSLRYLGPLTVLVVILVITFIVRQCPRAMRHLQASPLRAMCFLMILSFWSLAETSVDILTPTIITYSSTSSIYVVSHQPNIRYFSPKHLPVAIPALLILVVLVI